MMGSSAAPSPMAEVLEILKSPAKHRKMLEELDSRKKGLEKLIAKAGKAGEIDKLHAEAMEDANRAKASLHQAKEHAFKLVDEAKHEAEKIIQEAGVTVESLEKGKKDFEDYMTDCLKTMDSREERIKSKETELLKRQSSLRELSDALEREKAEIDRKMSILAQL